MAELPELSFRAVPEAERAARIERPRRSFELFHRSLVVARLRERSTDERARKGCLDRSTRLVGGGGRGDGAFGGAGGVPGVECDGRRGTIGPRGREGKSEGYRGDLGE